MDTDGFVDDVAGRCEFTSTNENLADSVVELAASWGSANQDHWAGDARQSRQGSEVPHQVHARSTGLPPESQAGAPEAGRCPIHRFRAIDVVRRGRIRSGPLHSGRIAPRRFPCLAFVHPDPQQLPRAPRPAHPFDCGDTWIRAGRATSRSNCRTSRTCRSPCTTECGSGRSASSGCPARLSGRTAHPSFARGTRARRSRLPRPTTATSRSSPERRGRLGTRPRGRARAFRSSRPAPSAPMPGRCSGRCPGCSGTAGSPTRSTTRTASSRRSTAC